MHQAGVRALTGLLQFAEPSADRRNMACACGHRAHYLELRSKSVLTAVGEARVSRPYYLCSHCSAGQFPVDVELDIQHTGLSPGVRRMLATVGSAAPFEDGRQQMQLLAGLEVTTKAVERTTEAVGAEWIWNLAADHFPGAVQIVDLYHARQHLWELVRKLYPNEEGNQKAWIKLHQKSLLDKGKIEKLVDSLRSINNVNPELAEKIRTEAGYFERNAERMRYPNYRRQHLFVGSGVIEAGCKTVIGSRLKRSGMFWTVQGANAILALRCCRFNGRLEDYWEARRAA